jgi:hypothetical protein
MSAGTHRPRHEAGIAFGLNAPILMVDAVGADGRVCTVSVISAVRAISASWIQPMPFARDRSVSARSMTQGIVSSSSARSMPARTSLASASTGPGKMHA